MTGADEQHQRDRRQDEQHHQPAPGVDLDRTAGVRQAARNDDCDGHGALLPGWIEHVLLERLFVVCHEQLFAVNTETNICFTNECLTWVANARTLWTMSEQLTARQRGILDVIETSMRERGYPPSVREIGEAVGLTSPSTVHSHLASLQRMGFLKRDPTKPRAIEVRFDPSSGAAIERRRFGTSRSSATVAAGTDVLAQENVEELFPLPEDFTGTGDLFIAAGPRRFDDRLSGSWTADFRGRHRAQETAVNGRDRDRGIPGREATVQGPSKRKGATISLIPANPRLEPLVFRRRPGADLRAGPVNGDASAVNRPHEPLVTTNLLCRKASP
jgi:repressor LexA